MKDYQEFYEKNKDKTKRWNSAMRSAQRQLIELHKEEYDLIFAIEKKKVGIKDRVIEV